MSGATEAGTMGKIVLMEYVSLDGVVQAPGNDQEDPEGFAHGGWTQPFFHDHRRYMPEILTAAGGYLLGRSTYDIFAASWPTVTDPDDVLARALNGRPKSVVPATLGSGKRLSPARHEPLVLKWVDTRVTAAGLVMITYRRPDRVA